MQPQAGPTDLGAPWRQPAFRRLIAVFLLNGIAGLLSMIANRLARVIDRGRYFEMEWHRLDSRLRGLARREIQSLEQRRRVCSWAINWCTAGAFLVCCVIVALFAQEYFAVTTRQLTGALFVSAMVSVIFGLSCFLREVYLATHATSFDIAHFDDAPDAAT